MTECYAKNSLNELCVVWINIKSQDIFKKSSTGNKKHI